jgi:hypothetical protein
VVVCDDVCDDGAELVLLELLEPHAATPAPRISAAIALTIGFIEQSATPRRLAKTIVAQSCTTSDQIARPVAASGKSDSGKEE